MAGKHTHVYGYTCFHHSVLSLCFSRISSVYAPIFFPDDALRSIVAQVGRDGQPISGSRAPPQQPASARPSSVAAKGKPKGGFFKNVVNCFRPAQPTSTSTSVFKVLWKRRPILLKIYNVGVYLRFFSVTVRSSQPSVVPSSGIAVPLLRPQSGRDIVSVFTWTAESKKES
jgi:hypothetical protein